MKKEFTLTHVDNGEEVDQIIPIEQIDSQKLYWKATGQITQPEIHTGYWPLKKYQGE